jgi:hypothetical protein
MDLKLDDKGAVVVQDGKPVFDDNGKDVVVDVSSLFSKITDLNTESAGRRRELVTIKDKFSGLKDVDDIAAYIETATKAIDTVSNMDDVKKLDAEKVEAFKNETKAAYEQKVEAQNKIWAEKVTGLEQSVMGKQGVIYDLMVKSQFAKSPYFTGEDKMTNLIPEIAESHFGKHFKVEENDSGKLVVAGYKTDGTRIFSRSNPGEPADFNESLAEIISDYPMKDAILKGGHGGSGGNGNSGGTGDKVSDLQKQYSAAMKERNVSLAMVIKRKIHAEQNG